MDRDTAIGAMRMALYGFAIAAGALMAIKLFKEKSEPSTGQNPVKRNSEPNDAMSSFVGFQKHGHELTNHMANDFIGTKKMDWSTGQMY